MNVVTKAIIQFFRSLGLGWVVKTVAAATSVSFMWAFHGIVKLFPEEAFGIMKNIAKVYFTPPAEWAGFIAGYIKQMTGADIDLEQLRKLGAGAVSKEGATQIGKAFMEPMLNLILPTPQEAATNPMGGANRFMSANLQFQMNAWMLHVLGDMVSFGAFKSLKDLPNAISWSFGLGWLSWLVMGPPFRFGIVEPMEKVFNKIYTPVTLTQPQAAQLTRHGLLSFEGYIQACLDIGIHPQQAAYLFEVQERELSDGHMKRLVELGWLSIGQVEQELTRRGFAPGRAQVLARLIRDSRVFELTEKIANAAGELYKDGVLERRALEGYLDKLGFTGHEKDLQVSLLELERSRRRFLTPAQMIRLRKEGKVDQATAKKYLTESLRYTGEDADRLFALEEVTEA